MNNPEGTSAFDGASTTTQKRTGPAPLVLSLLVRPRRTVVRVLRERRPARQLRPAPGAPQGGQLSLLAGLVRGLGVDPKQLGRWRKDVEPCGGAMHSIFRFASRMPGGLEIFMGEG